MGSEFTLARILCEKFHFEREARIRSWVGRVGFPEVITETLRPRQTGLQSLRSTSGTGGSPYPVVQLS
jgi:hypothetical protein